MASKVKSYKSIFRLDYPLSYVLLDHLGEFSEQVHKATQSAPFSKFKSDINVVEHSVTTFAEANNDPMRFYLALNNLNCVVEHPDGIPINTLPEHPCMKVADSVVGVFGETSLHTFNRVGFRSWIIVDDPKFKFETVKELILTQVNPFNKAINAVFETSNDIAITVEAKSEDDVFSRVTFGPYKAEEKRKYFSVDPKVEEALIIDIDVWKNSIKIPKFVTSNSARYYCDLIEKTSNKITAAFLEISK